MSSRGVRKRNIGTRDRNGCVTCRARRLKCDKTKPECNVCTRLSLPCRGYVSRLVFKDQTQLFGYGPSRRTRSSRRLVQSTPAIDPRQKVGHDIASDAQREQGLSDDSLAHPASVPDLQGDTSVSQVRGSHVIVPEVLPSGSNPLAGCASETIPVGDFGLTINSPVLDQELSSPTARASSPYSTPFFTPPGTSNLSSLHTAIDDHYRNGTQGAHTFKAAPSIPKGLFQSMMFPEDMLYYHHLRDTSPYGVLSVLYLNGIFDANYLTASVYHAALALSAIKTSKLDSEPQLRSKAEVHALEHYVTALGAISNSQVVENDGDTACPSVMPDTLMRGKAASWLSTVLFLAYYELQRGQMRLWYVHSRAAVDFLSSNLSLVLETSIGEHLIRAFSRIAALLRIYSRTHSVRTRDTPSQISKSLTRSLASSTLSYDRLLHILPRVNKLEEEWRDSLRHDGRLEERVDTLQSELKQWRDSLPPSDVPDFDDEETSDGGNPGERSDFDIKPCAILSSYEPVRAATNFAHYFVSLLRLDLMLPPYKGRKFTAAESAAIIRKICRLAVALPHDLCIAVNAYGHGILPAMMDAYHMADSTMADWIRKWIMALPNTRNTREGIWDITHVQRLLAYLEEEHSQGPRAGWTVVKTRMVELEDGQRNSQTESRVEGSDSFFVEIYSKGKRGWGIDFVEIE